MALHGQCPPSHPTFRISWHYDANSSGTCDGSDPTYFFCQDERWRIIATFRGTNSDPKERFVYHCAGLGGTGGGSYIDAMILADRDESGAFTAAADGVLEKRRYYGLNWRSDTAMLATDTGKLVENVKYFSNGVAAEVPAGDIDGNRTWDSTDAAAITGSYDVTKDVNMDGVVDSTDITQANAVNGGYLTTALALGLPSQVNNRKAYASYELEPNLLGSKFHVRNRVLDGELGRWSRRDPLGYVDGMGLYGYAGDAPTQRNDPNGLASLACTQGSCSADPVDPEFCPHGYYFDPITRSCRYIASSPPQSRRNDCLRISSTCSNIPGFPQNLCDNSEVYAAAQAAEAACGCKPFITCHAFCRTNLLCRNRSQFHWLPHNNPLPRFHECIALSQESAQ